MNWLSLTFNASNDNAEQISDALLMAGAHAVSMRNAGNEMILEPDPNSTPLWQDVDVIGLFPNDADPKKIVTIIKTLVDSQTWRYYDTEIIEDKDWVRLTQQQFKPIIIENKICVCPSWDKSSACDIPTVFIDPGLAFGTGTHETTYLCLEWLTNHCKDQNHVIDYGCGSGILSLAAARLGAKKITAIDHDEQAIIATNNNLLLNDLSNCEFIISLPNETTISSAELLISNIIAKPLIELAIKFADLVKPQGQIVLSGILQEQVDEVKQAYQNWFSFNYMTQKNEWCLLSGERIENR